MEFEFQEPILPLDDKIQLPESCNLFGYYAGPDPNKCDIEYYQVWIEDYGLLAHSVRCHSDNTTDHNRHMVPGGRETKE